MAEKTCPKCGKPLPLDAQFCSWCGSGVDSRSSVDIPLAVRLQESLGPNYEVLAELGRGGFAVVFSVRDLTNNQYLAVKVMRQDLVRHKRFVERFRREVQIASRLDHPNILPVNFSGEGRGVFYYGMPRVQGETLRRHLEERPGGLATADVLRIFGEVATALQCAHRMNVVHRDVKPGNIMLDKQGKTLVLDFGIAKALSADGGTLSVSGEVIGSAEYMSPEQASGSRDLDSRSDIYSLGVVGFELISGEVPFKGDNAYDVLAEHLSAEPPDVREINPEAPAAYAKALLRCLAKDPDYRWQTAEQAARAAGCSIAT